MATKQAGLGHAEGGCTCGEVRYRLLGPPLFVHCCHCTKCQTESGSAFALNAMVEADRVEVVAGVPEPTETPTESGNAQQVWRCPRCKVALWSHYGGAGPRLSFVRVGTLDAAAAVEPDIHIYTRSKVPWVRLPDGCLTAEAFYDRNDCWPQSSLERLTQLFTHE